MYRHCITAFYLFCLPGYWVAYKKLNKTLSSDSNHQESLHILDLCLHQLKSNNGKRQLKSEDFLYYKDANLIFSIITNSFTLLVNFYRMMVLIRIGRKNPEYVANRIRKMISFKLGKEIKKDVFSSCHKCGTKKMCPALTARISNIADPSSIQDKCCIWTYMTSQWALLTIGSLWLSGRASDCEIQRSEVWFLKGTQNFFFVSHLWQVKNTFFSTIYSWHKNLHKD